jgi:hypothetical protein
MKGVAQQVCQIPPHNSKSRLSLEGAGGTGPRPEAWRSPYPCRAMGQRRLKMLYPCPYPWQAQARQTHQRKSATHFEATPQRATPSPQGCGGRPRRSTQLKLRQSPPHASLSDAGGQAHHWRGAQLAQRLERAAAARQDQEAQMQAKGRAQAWQEESVHSQVRHKKNLRMEAERAKGRPKEGECVTVEHGAYPDRTKDQWCAATSIHMACEGRASS